MARVFSTACLVLVLCLGGAASASKPKIAILGLEVIPGPSGTVDPTVTQIARDITTDLRQRVQSDASPYAMAQNSTKELTDEKLLMSCDNEAASCMAVIGTGLSADFLLYGHIEKRGEVYRVSVRLLDVKTRSFDTTGEDMPVGTAAATMAKRLYTRLFGESAAITAGVPVAKAGPRTGTAIEIEQSAPPATPGHHSAVWKWSLGTGIALVVAGAGFAYYSNDQMVNHNKVTYTPAINPEDGLPYTNAQAPDAGDCGQSFAEIRTNKHAEVMNPDVFTRACTWKTRIYTGYIIGAAGALGAVVSLIMLTRDLHPESSPTGARRKKPGVAIAPILRPDAAGASLSINW